MRRNLRYSDFSGGLNTTDNPFSLAPNELQQCDNFLADRRGMLCLRRGTLVINSVLPAGTWITGLWRNYDTKGYGRLLGASISSLFTIDDVRGQLSDYPAFATGENVSAVPMAGRMFVFSNGKMSVWWSDGFQVVQPLRLPHTVAAFGSINMDYQTPTQGTNNVQSGFAMRYYLSFYTTYGDGNAYRIGAIEARSTYAAELRHIDILGIATYSSVPGDCAEYRGRKLYRCISETSEERPNVLEGAKKLVAVFEDMTTNTYEDNLPDSLLGEEMPVMEMPTGEGYACEFQNRIFRVWGRGSSEIRWTREFEPYSWPVSNAYTLGPAGRQAITALVPLSDRLMIFTRSRMYALYGDFDEADPNYSVSLVSNEVGCEASRSIAAEGQSLYFLSKNKVWKYDGNLMYLSRKIQKSLDGLPDATRSDAAGLVYDRKYWLSVSEDGANNDAQYVLDLSFLDEGREVWSRFDYGPQCYASALNDTYFEGQIAPIMAGHYNGYVYKFDYGRGDGYVPITGVMKTAPLDAGMPNDRKLFRKVWPWTRGTQATYQVQLRDDYGENYEVHTQSMAGNAYRPLPATVILKDTLAGNTMEAIVTYSQASYGIDILALEIEAIPRPHR